MMGILAVRGVSKAFGGIEALNTCSSACNKVGFVPYSHSTASWSSHRLVNADRGTETSLQC